MISSVEAVRESGYGDWKQMRDLQRLAWVKSTFIVDLLVLHVVAVFRNVKTKPIDGRDRQSSLK